MSDEEKNQKKGLMNIKGILFKGKNPGSLGTFEENLSWSNENGLDETSRNTRLLWTLCAAQQGLSELHEREVQLLEERSHIERFRLKQDLCDMLGIRVISDEIIILLSSIAEDPSTALDSIPIFNKLLNSIEPQKKQPNDINAQTLIAAHEGVSIMEELGWELQKKRKKSPGM